MDQAEGVLFAFDLFLDVPVIPSESTSTRDNDISNGFGRETIEVSQLSQQRPRNAARMPHCG